MKHFPLVLLLLFPFLLLAQTDAPILTLDLGMHTAKINSLDTDAAGKYVLTSSKDKTAKLWDAQTGKLVQTYRPPIGKGDEGMVYAVALYPGGKYVAMGGWSAYYPKNKTMYIYIFNTQSGMLVHRIGGLANVIRDLEFSKDGQYLVSALGGNNGIRIYNTTDWSLKEQDTDYGAQSENVAFAPNGGLATVADDGYLRLYNQRFQFQKKVETTGGKKPFSLSFTPDGKRLALSYYDSPTIQVLDAITLQVLYEPDISGATTLNDKFETVSFSEDGQELIAGGLYSEKQADGKYWQMIRIWKNQGKGNYQDYPAADNTITDIKYLKNGNIVFAGGQPDWGILDRETGKKIIYHAPPLNDLSKFDGSHFKINKDGSQIGLTPINKNPFSFDLYSRQLTLQSTTLPSYQANLGNLVPSALSFIYPLICSIGMSLVNPSNFQLSFFTKYLL